MPERWEADFLRFEAGTAFVLALVLVLVSELFLGPEHLDDYLDKHRFDVFPALATLFGALLGLVIAAAAVVLDRIAEGRLPLVQKSRHAPKLSQTFVSAMVWLGLATLVSTLVLIPTSAMIDRIAVYLWAFCALMVVARLIRTIWIVGYLMRIVSQQQPSSQTQP
jgi:hypothetical protein